MPKIALPSISPSSLFPISLPHHTRTAASSLLPHRRIVAAPHHRRISTQASLSLTSSPLPVTAPRHRIVTAPTSSRINHQSTRKSLPCTVGSLLSSSPSPRSADSDELLAELWFLKFIHMVQVLQHSIGTRCFLNLGYYSIVAHYWKLGWMQFHEYANLETQVNLGRVWVDIGTKEPLILDVLINALTQISSDFVGIKQVVFGGTEFEHWKEKMTSEEVGYTVHKI